MDTSPSKEVKAPQHDGTPRAHQLERVRDVDPLREVLHVFSVERVQLHEFPDGRHDFIR